MKTIPWKRSTNGGWFAIDYDGNRWWRDDHGERYTIMDADGRCGIGPTPSLALIALQEAA